MANNVIYWMTNLYCNNISSSGAWFIEVEQKHLLAMYPDDNWPENGMVCFCAEQIPSDHCSAVTMQGSPSLMASLNRWDKLAPTIGINEILALNHPVPIMRIGIDKYAAIDGSQILGGEHWQISDLLTLQSSQNHLARLAGWINARGTPKPGTHAAVKYACKPLMNPLMHPFIELERILLKLLPSADVSAVIAIIKDRVTLEKTRWHSVTMLTPA
ncbi:MAG: hypothetical protein NT086_11170 [Proteobacteria bacterium]|nr:hypothetical protein [Pseudomonadota bacterium]